ncbi:MAG TPA: DUF6350 family protein, partial [Nocardioides sp.]
MTTIVRSPSGPQLTDSSTRRPLALVATFGGAAAALSPLMVCLALGVVGWFVTDAGAHGLPRDGLRVGALAWLMAHGSGVHVGAVGVTFVPLGLTLMNAWVIWRFGVRVGESVSGHGPDVDAIADGERDWTVPAAVGVFGAAYVVVAVFACVLASTPATLPSVGRVVVWSVVLTLLVAGPAVAIGSGRAAIWASMLPAAARAAGATAAATLLGFLAVSAAVLAVALAADFGTAANVLSRLHTDAGDSALFTLLTATVTPNAVVFAGSYLLGPGFTVGAGTLVSPTLVAVGPVPAFPLLAALPANGVAPGWVVSLMGLPFLVAVVGAAYALRRYPATRWEEGALRGCVGGVLAGVGFAMLASVAGGSVGPGRMQDVAPFVSDVLVHGITSFGLGGLLGGVLMTWRERRLAGVSVSPDIRGNRRLT